jgi:predicted nucleic acid-binding Zn ribbon protein
MKIIYGVVEENGKRVRKYLALEPRQCLICGNEFEPITQTSKYCSRKCGKKADYESHRERYINRSRESYRVNIDEKKILRKKKYWSNPEKFRLLAKQYRELHKVEKNLKDNQYKDKVRHGGKKEKLIEEFGCVCSICGKEGTTTDIVAHHVTLNNQEHDNQILLCRSCHMRLHHPHGVIKRW